VPVAGSPVNIPPPDAAALRCSVNFPPAVRPLVGFDCEGIEGRRCKKNRSAEDNGRQHYQEKRRYFFPSRISC